MRYLQRVTGWLCAIAYGTSISVMDSDTKLAFVYRKVEAFSEAAWSKG